jgi:hypothetical protein
MIGKSFGELLKYVFEQKEKSADAIDYLRRFADHCKTKGNGEHFIPFKDAYYETISGFLIECPLTDKIDKVSSETVS